VSRFDPDPMATSVLFDVFVVGQAVRRLLMAAMSESPLRPEEYAVYSAIFELEQVTPTGMAERLGMPLTTVMDHLRVLERRGHVRRIEHPRDARSYLVVLTSEGLRAHREANRRFELAYQAFVDRLPEEPARAKAALLKIREAAEQALVSLAAEASPRSPGGRGG
jgi:MarR family transcriptional regulator, temperature-dependent positive regulator of motility